MQGLDLFFHFRTKNIIHAFDSSQMDDFNSLFSGLHPKSIAQPRLVQNKAARILRRTRKFDHISLVLACTGYSLPIYFKLSLLIYLRSADQLLLTGPRSRLERDGSRALAVLGPKLWNSLPSSLKLRQAV